MEKRQIIDFNNLRFEPFDNYGVVVPGMSWHKISYNKENAVKELMFLRWNQVQRACLMSTLDLKNF